MQKGQIYIFGLFTIIKQIMHLIFNFKQNCLHRELDFLEICKVDNQQNLEI